MTMLHQSVLLKETIQGLDIQDNDIVLDGTIGNAGHSLEISKSAKNIKIIGIDADQDAIENSKNLLEKNNCDFLLQNSYFDEFDRILKENNISKIDKALFDLGLRTDQIFDETRGFSFQVDGPLQMTFSKNPDENQTTAFDVVNYWEEENLADVIYGFGEERFSRRIAKAIVDARKEKEIKTTFELRDIIVKALPKFMQFKKIHPATKTFQAIRMAVNSELTRIENAINKSFDYLEIGGRLAIISFHSLEDRLVKRKFRELVSEGRGELINKRIIIPGETELKENPKSRSAKLRVIKKVS